MSASDRKQNIFNLQKKKEGFVMIIVRVAIKLPNIQPKCWDFLGQCQLDKGKIVHDSRVIVTFCKYTHCAYLHGADTC